MFTDYDKFPWTMFDIKINCSIRHFSQIFINCDKKWDLLDNRCLQTYLEEETLQNKNIVYDPP